MRRIFRGTVVAVVSSSSPRDRIRIGNNDGMQQRCQVCASIFHFASIIIGSCFNSTELLWRSLVD